MPLTIRGLSVALGLPVCYKERMDKTIRKYTSFDEMKADEYREWQELPDYERLNTAAELSLALYQAKEPTPNDVRARLQRTIVHLKRPQS